jgi:hypothetical protein
LPVCALRRATSSLARGVVLGIIITPRTRNTPLVKQLGWSRVKRSFGSLLNSGKDVALDETEVWIPKSEMRACVRSRSKFPPLIRVLQFIEEIVL